MSIMAFTGWKYHFFTNINLSSHHYLFRTITNSEYFVVLKLPSSALENLNIFGISSEIATLGSLSMPPAGQNIEFVRDTMHTSFRMERKA